jgi:hypothetical protein
MELKTIRRVKMKRRVFFTWIPAMMLVSGLTLGGCNNGSTGDGVLPGSALPGTITIIGISSQYNGQYAVFQAPGSAKPEGGGYLLTNAGSDGRVFNGVLIADGSVSLPVYLVPYDSDQLESYGGNDAGIKIYVHIKPYLP